MKLAEIATFTDNVEGMTAFYRALLEAEPVASSVDMAIFVVGDTKIFIHRTYIARPGELPPIDHTAFAVDDIEATCARLAAAGLAIEVPATDFYWGRSAYLRDPSGRLIELNQAE